jgi:hypothetical protein
LEVNKNHIGFSAPLIFIKDNLNETPKICNGKENEYYIIVYYQESES